MVESILNEWFGRSSELFVEIHVPRSAGEGIFYIIHSYVHYEDLIAKAESAFNC